MTAGQAQQRVRFTEGRRGFTFAGVALGSTLVLASALGIVAAGVWSSRLVQEKRDEDVAGEAARTMVEKLKRAPFSEILALYDADPQDDPAGPGTAPGKNFEVLGLFARGNDADHCVGEVMFPTISNALREDVADFDLSMPRDLNADGVVDSVDHAADYRVLPVRIRLQWRGRTADRTLVVNQVLIGPETR